VRSNQSLALSLRSSPNPNPHAPYTAYTGAPLFCLSLAAQCRNAPFWKRCGGLGFVPPHLHHHHIKILMHINPKLDLGFAAIKLAAGFLE